MGCAVFSLSYVLIMAGLAFGGSMTLIGFGGLLVTSFHRSLGSPLPLPTLHNASERRLYLLVGVGRIRRLGQRVYLQLERHAVVAVQGRYNRALWPPAPKLP